MLVDKLNVHRIMLSSYANGPGRRAVVWVQGCSLACPGCFNPFTHSSSQGSMMSVDEIVNQILDNAQSLEGVTISGGEPLQQIAPLTRLLQSIRQFSSLSTILFTGYSWAEITKIPNANDLLSLIDVVLAGRYVNTRRVASGLLGSANKTIHFLSPRYALSDLQAVPQAEIILEPDGEITLSGIDPIQW